MSVTPPQRLLLDALILPLPQAADAWRSWRESADLDTLDRGTFHLLPALAGRMRAWLANDPQQGILKGICRRAWSRNQLQKKLLADVLEILAAAGIQRVAATGPVLWASRYWPEGAIRPIGTVDLLVTPPEAALALEALSRAGWKAPDGIPDTTGSRFFFAAGVLLRSASGGEVRIHWRALPNTDLSIRRPEFPALEAMHPGSVARYAMPLEHSFVAALSGIHQDGVDWYFDALMISRQPGVRWDRVSALLRWRSRQRERLGELRRNGGAEIPPAVAKPVWTSGAEQVLAAALRAYRRARRRS